MSTVVLEFFDRNGVIHYSYHEKVIVGGGYRLYTASGKVPAEIAEQGVKAVRAYVDQEIQRTVGAKKERDRIFDENRRALNVPISCEHEGVLLRGRVISRNDDLVVDLESPVQGSEPLAWGNSFAGAMAGHKVWAQPGVSLTEEAVDCAKRQLVDIYKKVTSPVKDLVKKLNKKK